MAETSDNGALTGRARSLANLIPYRKGETGNPEGGRRHKHRQGVADYIAAKTRNLAALADFHLRVIDGEETNTVLDAHGNERALPASVTEKQRSVDWLGRYSIGRAYTQKQPGPRDDDAEEGKPATAEEIAKAMGMAPEEKQ